MQIKIFFNRLIGKFINKLKSVPKQQQQKENTRSKTRNFLIIVTQFFKRISMKLAGMTTEVIWNRRVVFVLDKRINSWATSDFYSKTKFIVLFYPNIRFKTPTFSGFLKYPFSLPKNGNKYSISSFQNKFMFPFLFCRTAMSSRICRQ